MLVWGSAWGQLPEDGANPSSVYDALFTQILIDAKQHRYDGRWDSVTIALLESGLQLSINASQPIHIQTQFRIELARMNMHRGETRQALAQAEIALASANSLSESGLISSARYLKSQLLLIQRDTASALVNAEEALAWARRTDDASIEVQALWGLGSVYEAQQESAQALKHFQEAIKLADAHQIHEETLVEALFHAGHLLDQAGEPEEALDHYQRAYDAAQMGGVGRLLAFAPYHRGRVYQDRLKQYEAALVELERSIVIMEARGLGAYFLVPITLQRMGIIYYEHLNDRVEGLAYFQRAIQVAERHGYERFVGRAFLYDTGLIGRWNMAQVFDGVQDVTNQHNPASNRWVEFKSDGSFVSDGDPHGRNTGHWTYDPETRELFLDSDAGEDDDSYWTVSIQGSEMEWQGARSEFTKRFKVIHIRG